MPNQQKKRRRKRYQQASACAGDVKPAGVLGFRSSATMIKFIFVGMALARTAGGGATIFGGNVFRTSSTSQDFVVPDDDALVAVTPAPTEEGRKYASPPPMDIDPERQYVAVISTDVGEIEVELFTDDVPETVNNFAFLADDGFYDGPVFHYVQPGFSAQAGDPACQAASLGSCRGAGGPGYELEQEGSGDFTMGTLGMINGSQFFIALSETSSDIERLAEYTPFGKVIGGLEYMEMITQATVIRAIEVG